MSMEVRVEAFDSLGKIENVSEDVLLQTLSKRVLGITKEMGSLGQCPAEEFEISASSVAGVFVHGLEDEFFEVTSIALQFMCYVELNCSSLMVVFFFFFQST